MTSRSISNQPWWLFTVRIGWKGVTIAKVDANWDPIPGTEQDIECDTLLLSVGLIPPENELSEEVGVVIDPPLRTGR